LGGGLRARRKKELPNERSNWQRCRRTRRSTTVGFFVLQPNRQVPIGRWRSAGLPRTTPVAIIEVSGRRWVWAPWGEVQWVRNLRAAGGATITVRRRKEEVRATELDPTQRVEFFRDILGPLARGIPFGVWFIRTVDGVDLDRPLEAAEGRRVFELHPLR